MKYKRLLFILFLIIGVLMITFFYENFNRKDINCNDCNVILISIDALRADHLGVYGYSKNITPNIDKIAKEGLIFANAYSQAPLTRPSISSLMTSKYPHEHGVFTNRYVLNESETTLAEILKSKKYTTAAFVGWSILHKKSFGQGFDYYNNLTENEIENASEINKEVVSWLEKNHNNKFFIWIHYMEPHDPYGCSKTDGSNKQIALTNLLKPDLSKKDIDSYVTFYDDGIKCLDDEIGNFAEKLKELDLNKNTVIIITADHGEGFYEHLRYIGHGVDLYNELIKIPLIIKLPQKLNKTVQENVESIDILPTILDVLGLEYKNEYSGSSLIPLIFGHEKNSTVYSEINYKQLDTLDKVYVTNMNDKQTVVISIDNNTENKNLERYFNHFLYSRVAILVFNETAFIDMQDVDFPTLLNETYILTICDGKIYWISISYLNNEYGKKISEVKNSILNSIRCNGDRQEIFDNYKMFIDGNFSVEYPDWENVPIHPTPRLAVISGKMKLIFTLNYGYEMYNLEEDPHELNNLISRDNETQNIMKKLVFNWINVSEPYPKDVEENLKKLGY